MCVNFFKDYISLSLLLFWCNLLICVTILILMKSVLYHLREQALDKKEAENGVNLDSKCGLRLSGMVSTRNWPHSVIRRTSLSSLAA